MQSRIRVITQQGVFSSRWVEMTEKEVKETKGFLEKAKGLDYLSLESDLGTIILPANIARNSVYIIETK